MPSPQPSAPFGAPGPAERVWRYALVVLSAAMGASALVDFELGRLAHGLGDAAVACLLISIEAQFPLLRALVRTPGQSMSNEEMLRQLQADRQQHPWPHRIGRIGWALLFLSLILRLSAPG